MSHAICEYCGRPMSPGSGCRVTHEKMGDGVVRKRIVFGEETHMQLEGVENCPDCNVRRGQPHHPSCDIEQCPKCLGQAFGCDDYLTPDDLAEFE